MNFSGSPSISSFCSSISTTTGRGELQQNQECLHACTFMHTGGGKQAELALHKLSALKKETNI